MSYAPSSPDDAYSSDAAGTLAGQYTLNNKIMVAAIIVLFFVVFFILSLHVHSKWIWTRSSSFMMSNRSSQGIYFVGGQEVNSAEAAHNIGLDKAAIDQLPTFIYKAPKAAGGGRELALIECAVCLSEFQESEKGRLLPTCKHSFHTDCIDMWFHSHSTCPLCRTVVMPIPLSSSTSEQQQQQQQAEDVQQQAENAMEAHLLTHNDPLLRAREGTSVPSSTINYGNAMLQCPSNALVWGNQTQVISQLSSSQGSEKPPSPPTPPSCSSSSSSTRRSIPQITIEIPTRQDNLTSPGCLSLSSLSRSWPSPSDQACSSQPIKSPGLRMSIKRKLSRQSSKGKRIFGSYLQEGGHSPKDITTLPV